MAPIGNTLALGPGGLSSELNTSESHGADPIEKAKQAIEKAGFGVKIYGNGDKVTEQMPKANSKVSQNSGIVLYTEPNQGKHMISVPDVRGMAPAAANKTLTDAGLNVKIKGVSNTDGAAICSGQLPIGGTTVETGTVITLSFSYSEVRD